MRGASLVKKPNATLARLAIVMILVSVGLMTGLASVGVGQEPSPDEGVPPCRPLDTGNDPSSDEPVELHGEGCTSAPEPPRWSRADPPEDNVDRHTNWVAIQAEVARAKAEHDAEVQLEQLQALGDEDSPAEPCWPYTNWHLISESMGNRNNNWYTYRTTTTSAGERRYYQVQYSTWYYRTYRRCAYYSKSYHDRHIGQNQYYDFVNGRVRFRACTRYPSDPYCGAPTNWYYHDDYNYRTDVYYWR